jgi:integrase
VGVDLKKRPPELPSVAVAKLDLSRSHPVYPKLLLFKTPNGKSANWYAGFHMSGRHRTSLGTSDYTEALKRAERWYEDTRYKVRNGGLTPPSTPRFGKLVKATLEGMRVAEKSPVYINGVATCLAKGSDVIRFFGSMAITDVNSRAWDQFRAWLVTTRATEGKSRLSEKSVHQRKNAVRLVLRQAYVDGLIQAPPRFEDPMRPVRKEARPRTYFTDSEYEKLWKASLANVRRHRKQRTRWVADAEELHDYIVFMVNTGLRVGESRALRVRDVKIARSDVIIGGVRKTADLCKITVREGKRGAHPPCVSYLRAPDVFRRILKRRGITDPSVCQEPLFLRHHREAFKRLLREIGLYTDEYGRKRDFVSLRHTYICFRLNDGASAWQVAQNARTSVEMIQKHYAKSLAATSIQVNVTG